MCMFYALIRQEIKFEVMAKVKADLNNKDE